MCDAADIEYHERRRNAETVVPDLSVSLCGINRERLGQKPSNVWDAVVCREEQHSKMLLSTVCFRSSSHDVFAGRIEQSKIVGKY